MVSLCINDTGDFKTPEEMASCLKKVGFDGAFLLWDEKEKIYRAARALDKAGLFMPSLHAPFVTMHTIWKENDPAGDDTIAVLKQCVDCCVDFEIPVLVCHAFIGFLDRTPTETGLSRLAPLMEYGIQKKVKIAFENTEGEEYLAAIMNRFADCESLGFCWDTGHELCYNRAKDMMALYGDKLVSTHLNDNFGVTGEEITWLDDSHVLPFDGVADWNGIADRLLKVGFTNPLTFELTRQNKPERHTHDGYAKWSVEEFFENAHERAVRFAALMEARAAK